MYQFAYLMGAVFWFLIWLILLFIWPRQRRAMIWSGLLLGGAGPISEYWFLQDYWILFTLLNSNLDPGNSVWKTGWS